MCCTVQPLEAVVLDQIFAQLDCFCWRDVNKLANIVAAFNSNPQKFLGKIEEIAGTNGYKYVCSLSTRSLE